MRLFIVVLVFGHLRCQNYDLYEALANPDKGTPCTRCRIFVTANAYDGNLGGLAGADEKCNADPQKPAGSRSFKALLHGGDARRPCDFATGCTGSFRQHTTWVLWPDKTYYRADGVTVIQTTNAAAVWPVPISLTNSIDTISTTVLTAFSADWSMHPEGNCGGWTTTLSGRYGGGNPAFLNGQSVANLDNSCSTAAKLYCAEQ